MSGLWHAYSKYKVSDTPTRLEPLFLALELILSVAIPVSFVRIGFHFERDNWTITFLIGLTLAAWILQSLEDMASRTLNKQPRTSPGFDAMFDVIGFNVVAFVIYTLVYWMVVGVSALASSIAGNAGSSLGIMLMSLSGAMSTLMEFFSGITLTEWLLFGILLALLLVASRLKKMNSDND